MQKIFDNYTGEDLTDDTEGWYSFSISKTFPGKGQYHQISNGFVAVKKLENIAKYIKWQEKALKEEGVVIMPL